MVSWLVLLQAARGWEIRKQPLPFQLGQKLKCPAVGGVMALKLHTVTSAPAEGNWIDRFFLPLEKKVAAEGNA